MFLALGLLNDIEEMHLLLNQSEIQHNYDELIELLSKTVDEMSNFGAETLSLTNVWTEQLPEMLDFSLLLPPQLRDLESFVKSFPDSIYSDPHKFEYLQGDLRLYIVGIDVETFTLKLLFTLPDLKKSTGGSWNRTRGCE